MTSRRTGLTLVELLVVIGLVGVLTAILLPAIRAARLAARNTLCASRLRELVAASTSYQIEHGVYPPANYSPAIGLVVPHFMRMSLLDALAPYLHYGGLSETAPLAELPDVVQCPFVQDFEGINVRGPIPLPGGTIVNTGYQYTGRLDEHPNSFGVVLRPERVAGRRGNKRGVVWSDALCWYSGSGIPILPPAGATYAYFHFADALTFNGLGPSDSKAFRGQHRAWSDGSVEWVSAKHIRLTPMYEIGAGPTYELTAGGSGFMYFWF